ncbi:MAG: DEAD/DEAH box helicase [Anaerolineae bacterium]|nr:DEAD/DEAH box helicase [Anaerolineae bacterium]
MTASFHDLGLAPELLTTLQSLGYAEPTPIQAQAIPPLLAGQDVLGQAQTGTGKTAAFTLPALQNLDANGLQVLILTPTRELAIQVAEAVHRYGSGIGVRVLPIYGGQSYDRQIRRLRKGVQVVVGTPGRTLDLIDKKELNVRDVRYLVLDEADEMLKMGFIEDIELILKTTDASERQTSLFSATFTDTIRRLAQKYMRDPLQVSVEFEEATCTNVNQRYYVVQEDQKVAALSRLLEVENQKNTLIFTRTKIGAAELAETLMMRGYPAAAIHGDLSQAERERIVGRFRSRDLTILVATDVMARGVDIPDVSHVINYDIPQLSNEYVHRIGRTGRAGRSGDAITLVTPRQRRLLKMIEDFIGKPITRSKLPDRETVLQRRESIFKAGLLEQIGTYVDGSDEPLLDELLAMGYSAEQVAAGIIKSLRAQQTQRPLEEIREVTSSRELPQQRAKKSGRYGSHEPGMVRLCMNVGRSNGLRPADVVYSIASKANIPGSVIGAIDIQHHETYLDIPDSHVDVVLHEMKHYKIRGQMMKLARANERERAR